MSQPYESFCDDFYMNLRLGTHLALPTGRDALMPLLERMQKSFPSMRRFRKSEQDEYFLEEDRAQETYRWVCVEPRRMSGGYVNPSSIAEASKFHATFLELAPHFLSLSPLEVEYVDVLFGFDFSYNGNHDEVVAEGLLGDSPLTCLLDEPETQLVDFQPTITFALGEDRWTQARVEVVTRANGFRDGESNELLSVYLIVRRFWGDLPVLSPEQCLPILVEKAQSLAEEHVLRKILRPIGSAIASRS